MSDASDVPAVRYPTAYTPENPPPATRVCLCTSCDRYMHMTVVRRVAQPNGVDFLLRCPVCDSDFVEQGWPIRDWENRPGGQVYPNLSAWADVSPDELIVLGRHVVGAARPPMTEPLPCIVCGFQPKPVIGGSYQPLDALMFDAGSGHYGSGVWDTMNGRRALAVNVCDECLVANRTRVGVFVSTPPQRAEVELVPWEPDVEDSE